MTPPANFKLHAEADLPSPPQRDRTPQPQADGAEVRSTILQLIEQRLFHVAFQPIVSLETGEVAAFEALTRPDKTSGFPGPAELFSAAEKLGLIWELEDAVRGVTLESISGLPDGMRLFFNSTPVVAADARFADRVDEQVRANGEFAPGRLVLEVTEHAEGASIAPLCRQTSRIKDLGFQLAIDDVGAGSSGLNRIMQLRPHWLKLDRELIGGIDTDQLKQNLVRFLVEFAGLSGVNLLAEGMERQEELATLIDIGVRYAQGFFLARPHRSYQQVKPDTATYIRDRWRQARGRREHDSLRYSLSTLCQPARTVQVSTPTAEVAAELIKSGDAGAVVVDGRRYIGWCPREVALRAASASPNFIGPGFLTQSCEGSIGFCLAAGDPPLSPTNTVAEALMHLSMRGEHNLSTPLVVVDGEVVVGVIPTRTLLAAAASGAAAQRATQPVTGLPGRVAAELIYADLIRRAGTFTPAAREAVQGVIIDVIGISRINGSHGYETGDLLIRSLALLIQRHVLDVHAEPGFVTHLADDRFFVVAERGGLRERLGKFASEFEAVLKNSIGHRGGRETNCLEIRSSSGQSRAGSSTASTPGLRLLLVPNLLSKAATSRDLTRIEHSLRQRAARDLRKAVDRSFVLVEDQRRGSMAA